VGGRSPPANAGCDSKQLVAADPAEKMAARRLIAPRPGDAGGGLKAAAVANSSPAASERHRISCVVRTLTAFFRIWRALA